MRTKKIIGTLKEFLTYKRVLRAERIKYARLTMELKETQKSLQGALAMLELEKANTSCLYDCRNFLWLALCDAENQCEQTENIKNSYKKIALSLEERRKDKKTDILGRFDTFVQP